VTFFVLLLVIILHDRNTNVQHPNTLTETDLVDLKAASIETQIRQVSCVDI
jgi:hypothetical protein